MEHTDILDDHFDGDKALRGLQFSIYKSFHTPEEMAFFTELLDRHDIPYKTGEQKLLIDPVIVGTNLAPKYWVEVPNEAFPNVNALLESESEKAVSTADLEKHYLNDLSSAELLDVLMKPDEWSFEAVAAAKGILQLRGVSVEPETIQQARKNRIEAIRTPREIQPFWLFFYGGVGALSGYHLIILISLICMAMGGYYHRTKSTDPNGDRYFEFGEKTRRGGLWVIGVSLVGLVAGVVKLFLER